MFEEQEPEEVQIKRARLEISVTVFRNASQSDTALLVLLKMLFK